MDMGSRPSMHELPSLILHDCFASSMPRVNVALMHTAWQSVAFASCMTFGDHMNALPCPTRQTSKHVDNRSKWCFTPSQRICNVPDSHTHMHTHTRTRTRSRTHTTHPKDVANHRCDVKHRLLHGRQPCIEHGAEGLTPAGTICPTINTCQSHWWARTRVTWIKGA